MAKKKVVKPRKTPVKKAEKSAKESLPESELLNHVELKFIRLVEINGRLRIRDRKVPYRANIDTDLKAGPTTDGKVLIDMTVTVVGLADDADSPEASRLDLAIHYQLAYDVVGATLEAVAPHVDALAKNAMLILWPHVREMIQSTTARMNVPPITLPILVREPGAGGPAKNVAITI